MRPPIEQRRFDESLIAFMTGPQAPPMWWETWRGWPFEWWCGQVEIYMRAPDEEQALPALEVLARGLACGSEDALAAVTSGLLAERQWGLRRVVEDEFVRMARA